jgi:hypothetical protein
MLGGGLLVGRGSWCIGKGLPHCSEGLRPFADSLNHFVVVAPTHAANGCVVADCLGTSGCWTLVARQRTTISKGLRPSLSAWATSWLLCDHAANGSG